MESRGSNYLIKVAIEIGIGSGSRHNKTQIKVMRRLSGRCANIWAHFTSSSWGPSCITWPQVIILHMPTQPQQKHVKWQQEKQKIKKRRGEQGHTQNLACQVLLRSCFSAWLAFWLGLPNSYAVSSPLSLSFCLPKMYLICFYFLRFVLNFWRLVHINFWYMCVMHVVIWCGKLLCILMSSRWGCHLPLVEGCL